MSGFLLKRFVRYAARRETLQWIGAGRDLPPPA